jgi:cold shock CspA family protein
MSERHEGKIQFFNVMRGFGFILVNFNERYFFHVSDYRGKDEPRAGQPVYFSIGPGKPGKPPQAVDVMPAPETAAVAALAGEPNEHGEGVQQ